MALYITGILILRLWKYSGTREQDEEPQPMDWVFPKQSTNVSSGPKRPWWN